MGVPLDARAQAAIAASSLGSLPPDVIAALCDGAEVRGLPARSNLLRDDVVPPHVVLVVAGLIRLQVTAVDGRAMTVRYCRTGSLLGIATLYAPVARPFTIEALVDSVLLRLDPAVVLRQADSDLRVARALLAETSERVVTFVAEFSGHAFSTVRERIARHLLDLAVHQPRAGTLVALVTQQDIADAVGTVREVVVRTLRELRDEGVVRTGRGGIVILDPERLSRYDATSWNESP